MNWYQKQKIAIKWQDIGKGFLYTTLPFAPLSDSADTKLSPNTTPIPYYSIQDPTGKSVTAPEKSIQLKENNDFIQRAKEMIIRHEGKKYVRYNDSRGILTVGVGFNLTRKDAPQVLSSLGLNYNDVINGKQLSNLQVEALFNITFDESVKSVKQLVPSFNEQPNNIKIVLINMMFNLGPSKMKEFKRFLRAIENKDYKTAAKEMVDSKWYNQVKNRSKELVDLVRQSSAFDD